MSICMYVILLAVYFCRCVSGSMEHRRKWRSLYPVVSLCGASDYDEVLKKIFGGNPAISGDVLHAFLLSGYQVNVAASELDQWIYEARLHYASPLFAYDDLLRGCYNVQPTKDASYFCGVLADSGVDCTIASMECWMLLQTPPVDAKLTDYNTFLAGWEIVAYDDFLRGCCVAMPGINAIQLRVALMQTMGCKCRLAHMEHWMKSNTGVCKVTCQKRKKPMARRKFVKKMKRGSMGRRQAWNRRQ